MSRSLLALIALAAIAAAAVMPIHRERRQPNNTIKCDPETPCAWSTFEPDESDEPGIIEINITSTFCICRPGTLCSLHTERGNHSFTEYRCKPTNVSLQKIL